MASSTEQTAGIPNPERIMQVGLGFWASKTLLSAVGLGLFTELAHGPLALDELRDRLGLDGRGARDFFDALVALGFLERSAEGRYSNTRESELFLDRAKPTYLGGLLEMANERLYPFWNDLPEALRTGEPQNEVKHGGDLFDGVYADPVRLEHFLHSMTGLSMGTSQAIAGQFPWDRYKSFADVGCAEGGLAVEVARADDHLAGIGLDLPPARQIFEKYVAANGLSDRVRFQAGDFFSDPLPTADVITMGHILHDWDLPTKKTLLAKAYQALPPGGAILVFEAVIDDGRRENVFGLLMSLNMLIETRGGSDYTGADCRGWMEEVGFRETYVESLVGPDSMVVGLK